MTSRLDNYYESIASGYDILHGQEQLEKQKIIQKFIAMDPEIALDSKLLLLDIGCGTGISTTTWPCLCFGLDPALELLQIANNKRMNEINHTDDKCKQLGYIQGIAEKLPIKSNSCDIVITITSIHNFFDVEQSLKEIKRIATKKIIISVLKKSKNFNDILKSIKDNFRIIRTTENDFDYFFYITP